MSHNRGVPQMTTGTKLIAMLAVAGLLTCVGPTGATAKSYEGRLEDIATAGGLPEKDIPRLATALEQVAGYGVCAGPLATHLRQDAPHPLCRELGAYVAYMLSRKADKDSIDRLMVKRRTTMCAAPPHQFDLRGSPSKGPATATVTLVEFFDFQCWACQRLSGVLETVLAAYPDTVRLYHKQYPLKNHKGSALASMTALAAHRQGQYWDMANLLFVIAPDHTEDKIFTYAKELKLDLPRLKRDLQEPAIKEAVIRDKKEGRKAGITATPALFINGRTVDLPDDEFILKSIISEELRRLQGGADASCS